MWCYLWENDVGVKFRVVLLSCAKFVEWVVFESSVVCFCCVCPQLGIVVCLCFVGTLLSGMLCSVLGWAPLNICSRWVWSVPVIRHLFSSLKDYFPSSTQNGQTMAKGNDRTPAVTKKETTLS